MHKWHRLEGVSVSIQPSGLFHSQEFGADLAGPVRRVAKLRGALLRSNSGWARASTSTCRCAKSRLPGAAPARGWPWRPRLRRLCGHRARATPHSPGRPTRCRVRRIHLSPRHSRAQTQPFNGCFADQEGVSQARMFAGLRLVRLQQTCGARHCIVSPMSFSHFIS